MHNLNLGTHSWILRECNCDRLQKPPTNLDGLRVGLVGGVESCTARCGCGWREGKVHDGCKLFNTLIEVKDDDDSDIHSSKKMGRGENQCE